MSRGLLVQHRAPSSFLASRHPTRGPVRVAAALSDRLPDRASKLVWPVPTQLAAATAAVAVLLSCSSAGAREQVAEFATSGLIFKDTVKVIELEDEQVSGVVLYFTDYNRSITERLSKDFFSDPSQASLTCVANKPVVIKDMAAIVGSEGQEIFKERKALNFFQNKNLRVRRIYDDQNKVIIYVAYSTRLTGAANEKEISTSRYRTSVCAVPVSTAPALVEAVAEPVT